MTNKEFLSQYKDVIRLIKMNEERMQRNGYSDSLCEENEELMRLKFLIEDAIVKSRCSIIERTILWKRYIEGKKWETIAEETIYSLQHVYRINRTALSKISCDCYKMQNRFIFIKSY